MKKLISIILLCLLLAACAPFSAASSLSSTASEPMISSNTDSEAVSSSGAYEHWSLLWDETFNYPVFIGLRCAAYDGKDTYILGQHRVGKVDASGKVSILAKIPYGQKVAVHGDYVYCSKYSAFYKISKDGAQITQIAVPKEKSIVTFWIYEDTICMSVTDDSHVVEPYHADLTGDPDVLDWQEGYGDIKYPEKITVGYLMDTYFVEKDGTELSPEFPFCTTVDLSDKYVYFYREDSSVVYRRDLVTREEEKLSIPFRHVAYFNVENGWIYYVDPENNLYRTSEDLTQTELLIQYDPTLP